MALFRAPLESPDQVDKRPVIFDILGPDYERSILPDGWRLVLYTNPQSMQLNYAKRIARIQTKGGFVEQHWGDDAQSISFAAVSGGFMRLYSGLSNTTNPAAGGTRRETLAYDRYLDFLALFHNNGSVYDSSGQIIWQGIIKIIFDGGIYYGWFADFSVDETSDKPFMFTMTCTFTVSKEIQSWKTAVDTEAAINAIID